MPKKTNIEINGSSYYRVTATIGKDSDGKPIRKQFYGSSKKEAEAKRDEFQGNIKDGLNTDYKEMSIEKLMKIWLFNVVKIDASYNTFDRYESVYRNYIVNSSLSGMKVYEVKRLFLQCYYNKMIENGYSANKVFNLNKLLKIFFNYAVGEGYILKNPCFGITMPKQVADEESDTKIDPLTDEEIEKILEAAKGNIRIIFQLGVATGLRRGELLGLQLDDIDLDNLTLKVGQALKKVKKFDSSGNYEYVTLLEQTKTKNSIRTVPIPSSLRIILKQHITMQKEKHFKLGVPYTNDSLLFTSNAGTPFDGKNVLISWERLLKRAGVRYRCFHNIRHTYATKLFEAGVPLKTVSVLLGHANISITADTYTHVMPKEKNNAAEKLNYLFVN